MGLLSSLLLLTLSNQFIHPLTLSCTKRGNVSKFPKPGRYETGPQKMETSRETPYIKKIKNIYIYIYFLNKTLYCKKNIMIHINNIFKMSVWGPHGPLNFFGL
jgi:hypothetical protein